jgi:hypothetical protein
MRSQGRIFILSTGEYEVWCVMFLFKERLTLNPLKGTKLSRFKDQFHGFQRKKPWSYGFFYETSDICESFAISI